MIKVFEPNLTIKDKFSVLKALSKNNISGTSPIIQEFEEDCARYFDRKYCVALSNGSTSLEVALRTIDFKEGDEVVLPSFTIISCLSAVVRAGATPIFCDVNMSSWNMTLNDLKKSITQKTKAVLMVHTYGYVADAIEIENYCSENNLILIEDSAEAHGQTILERKCGSFGEISTLSFYANKHVTTGEGGAILTNNKKYYQKILQMRNLDFSEKRFIHENLYWNYRLSSLQAALGISQLKNIDKVIEKKVSQGGYYIEKLKKYNKLIKLPINNKDQNNHFWVFGILLMKDNIRDIVIKDLKHNGIETRPFFWPLHLQPALPKKFKNNVSLPVSENLGNNGFYIPIGSHLKKSDQDKIINCLVESVTSNS